MTEPPFPHFDKPAGPIEQHATTLLRAGERYAQQSLQIRRQHGEAISATSGLLFQPLVLAPDPAASKAVALGRQSLVFSGATKLWAGAIQTFNQGVDTLNTEWTTSLENSFGLTEPVPHGNAEVTQREAEKYSNDYAAAKRAKIRDLQRRYEHLKNRLDDTATGVHQLYKTDPSDYEPLIAAMVGAGLLPNSLTTSTTPGEPAPLPTSMAAVDPCLRGNDFEDQILRDLGLSKNTVIYDVLKDGRIVERKPFAPRDLLSFMFKRGTIPDGVTATNLIEIKDVTGLLGSSSQLRQQIELAIATGKKLTFVLGPESKGLSPALVRRLEEAADKRGLEYEVKQVGQRGDPPTWTGGKPDVGQHKDPDDPGIQPPLCGPDDPDPPSGPDPVPVPVPQPQEQPQEQPDDGGFDWGGLVKGAAVVGGVIVVGGIAIAGAPETGGGSLGLLALL